MAGSIRDGALVQWIGALYNAGTSTGLADAQLLERITSGRDAVSGLAFEAIVARHGRMVLNVCRQVLDDPHDAEDAFQATFLVLAQRARSIRCGDSLASWLFGVTRRVCARARVDATRRRIHERQAAERMARSGQTDSSRDYAAIHEEIARLPERYRLPVVLCYLEGLTYEAAAERLQCPLGTLSIRLSRARDRLRPRLLRRGLTAYAGILTVASTASAGIPAGLATESTRHALRFIDHPAAGGGTVPSNVVNLARGVLKAMQTTTKMKMLVLGFGMVVVAGLGGRALSGAGAGGRPHDQATPGSANTAASPLVGDLVKLQGIWIEIDPGRINKEIVSATWEIAGTTLINRTTRVDGREGENRSEIRLDEQIVPHGIDLVQRTTPKSRQGVKDKETEIVQRCIYKIDGDTLTLCGPQGFDEPRPTKFPTAGRDGSVLVLNFRRGNPLGPDVALKPAAVPPESDLARFQGTWAAEALGPERDTTVTVKVEGDVMTMIMATPSSHVQWVTTVTLDEKTRPRSLDLASNGPKPVRMLGIYKLDGDTLTLRCAPAPAPGQACSRGRRSTPSPFSS